MAHLDLHVEFAGLTVSEAFSRLFQHYAGALGLSPDCLVEVILADDTEISRVHEESHGDPDPTDCIAFPTCFPEMTGGPELLGAFYMGVEEVARNAQEQGEEFSREVAFVLAHGLLHLMGHEDGSEAERAEMFRRQGELLEGFLAAEGGLPTLLILPEAG